MIVTIDGPAERARAPSRGASPTRLGLSLPRHRRHVPRAHVAGARGRCLPRGRRRARDARRGQPHLIRGRARLRPRARTSRRRSAGRASTASSRLGRAASGGAKVMRGAPARARGGGRRRHRRPRHRHRRLPGRGREGLPRRGRSSNGRAAAWPSAPRSDAEALATDLRLRDERDSIKMQPAEDAEMIDTTELSVDEVVAQIEQLVQARSAGA